MNEKNLYQRILAVSQEVKNIGKDMTVGSGTYSYKAVSDLAVTLVVKSAEELHGVVSIPIKQELVSSEVYRSVKKESYNGRDTEKETFTYVDNIKMTVRFINVDNTDEYVDVETFGKGIDTGDKGFGKASTYARKYALLNAYKIATGDDPDKDASPQDDNGKGSKAKPEPQTYQQAPQKEQDQDLALKKKAIIEIKSAKTVEALDVIYENYPKFHESVEFKNFVNTKRNELLKNQ